LRNWERFSKLGAVDPVALTVDRMKRLARAAAENPEFRTGAAQLVRPGRFLLGDLWRTVGRIPYQFDPAGVELVRDPLLYLRQLGILPGDCDDQSTFGAALVRAVSPETPVDFVTCGTKAGGGEHHVFLRVGGVPVDPITAGSGSSPWGPSPAVRFPGWEPGREKPYTALRLWRL
jgi:hypothetical protein